MSFAETVKKVIPRVPKRALLFIAMCVWMCAGGILLTKGFVFLSGFPEVSWWQYALCFGGGILFYVFMFSKISGKHINRIKTMPMERPYFFAFFNARSYILMLCMITMGIVLRKSNIVPLKYMALFYLIMGTPLFLSALRFLYSGIRFHKKIT